MSKLWASIWEGARIPRRQGIRSQEILGPRHEDLGRSSRRPKDINTCDWVDWVFISYQGRGYEENDNRHWGAGPVKASKEEEWEAYRTHSSQTKGISATRAARNIPKIFTSNLSRMRSFWKKLTTSLDQQDRPKMCSWFVRPIQKRYHLWNERLSIVP